MHRRVAECPCSDAATHFVFSFERTARILGRTALCHHGLCARPYRHLPRGSLCRFQIEIRVIITRRFLVFLLHRPPSEPARQPPMVETVSPAASLLHRTAIPHLLLPPAATTPAPDSLNTPMLITICTTHRRCHASPLPTITFCHPVMASRVPWLPSLGRPTPKQFGPCIAGHATNGGGG
jgi:hypothetical protein